MFVIVVVDLIPIVVYLILTLVDLMFNFFGNIVPRVMTLKLLLLLMMTTHSC